MTKPDARPFTKRDALAALALCEAATPGPWITDDADSNIVGIFAATDLGAICYLSEDSGSEAGLRPEDRANGDFIAAARAALPAAIKMLERAAKILDAPVWDADWTRARERWVAEWEQK